MYISKGGFNDKIIEIKKCDVHEIPSWIKMNAQWWIENKIYEIHLLKE